MKIICIGRNYKAHAAELNNSVPKQPLFFMKPDTAILPKNNAFFYPDFTQDLHYECELVIRIKKVGKNIAEKFAHEYYDEIGLGIDLTARDLQQECKLNGRPWEIAKSFEYSAPMSATFLPLENKNIQDLHFTLHKNGAIVQEGYTGDMIFSVDYLISYLSRFMTLKIGDYIFTGTPSGVGSLSIGDELEGTLEGKNILHLKIK